MPNSYFQFKQFRVNQERSGMKVTTDACLFGAWVASELANGVLHRSILDIGTGTGLLTLMVAQANTQSLIHAVEINNEAYEESNRNFLRSPWSERITSELVSVQEHKSVKYDAILCNPPFFEGNQLGKGVNKNEAVHSTLLPQKELLNAILRLLSPEGKCYILYPKNEMNAFSSLAREKGLVTEKMVEVRNKESQSIFRLMTVFSKKDGIEIKSQVNIRENDGRYTQEFWNLLKDYYLEYNNPDNQD